MIKQGETRKMIVSAMLVAALLFPSLASSASHWVYFDESYPHSNCSTTGVVMAYNKGHVAYYPEGTYVNAGTALYDKYIVCSASGLFVNPLVPVPSGTSQFPAPIGYYTQEEYDAALAGSGGTTGTITLPDTLTFQFPFDVPTYSMLVGWFLGIMVLAFGIGATYRVFVKGRWN